MEPNTPTPTPAPQIQPTPTPPPSEPAPVNSTGFEGDPAELHVNVPDGDWPGAFGIYKFSKQAVMVNFWTLIGFFIIAGIGAAFDYILTGIVGNVISYLLSAFASAGFALTFIAGVRGQRLDLKPALTEAAGLFIKVFLLNILVVLALGISFILFIIPVFFVIPRLTLVTYFLVDKNMGVLEAFKASWHATKGNALKAWGIIAVGILFGVLSLLLIGIYLSVMYSAAFAVLYEYLNRRQSLQAAEPAPAQPAQPPANPTPPTEPAPPTV